MDQEAINRDLQENDSNASEFQKKLLTYVKNRMKLSSDKMCQYHDQWDANSYVYRGYRVPDKKDAESAKDGTPVKIIVPIAYAQAQTALSFLLSTFTQRNQLIEVVGNGPEDVRLAQGMNQDLGYQTQRAQHVLYWYFWMLDCVKQGFGVVRNDWVTETTRARVMEEQPLNGFASILSAFGMPMKTTKVETVKDIVTFEGNRIRNVSPYSFYPDPSCSLARFQEGEFVAVEDEFSRNTLLKDEGVVYYGVQKIPQSATKELTDFRKRRFKGPFREDSTGSPITHLTGSKADEKPILVSEMEFTLSEKDASKEFGMDLGNDPKPVKWLVVMANDQKIIRFEKISNLHGQYNFNLIEFSPDADAYYNPGLVETIFELQTLVNFFLNSHVANVRKIIANRFIVREDNVNIDDLKKGSIYIRAKGAFADLDKVIKQLNTSDITKGNVDDMQNVLALIQQVTGINENALGQYAGGRRSATEARNVNAGAAARLKMIGSLMYAMGIEPLAKQQLSNTRQWRTKDVYAQIVGNLANEAPYEQVILTDPSKLSGGYDFMPYDATLPSDKQFQAGVLTELFTTLISNPNAMQLLNMNPAPLMKHIAKLHGIKNIEDFEFPQLPQQGVPQAQIVGDAQIQQAMNQGAEPVDMTGEDVLRGLAQ